MEHETALMLESYHDQRARWPAEGRHILAQYDEASVVVYQAYRPAIGHYAAQHGRFGGEFSLNRMSWIKPNFLWMMYRSGWGTKDGQEVTLAIWLRRAAFEEILREAVPSSFTPDMYASHDDWQAAVARSSVRLQWDPDHDPHGRPLARRAIQLGLRGDALARFAGEWLLRIEDISPLVARQHEILRAGDLNALLTPHETVYPVADAELARRLGTDDLAAQG
ncbi:MAG TPA: DUF4291 domain-containing protein [Ktedonobacterales bacterium]|jgi:uncharacterized protein DUF4291|nr:DUF4291 domain-containing protein [Ktedonobacterales bacterium]